MEKKAFPNKDYEQKVDALLANLRAHPNYSDYLYKENCASLREESLSHSLSIELNPNEGKKSDHGSLLKKLRTGEQFLEKEGLSVYSLACLGNIVEPSKNPNPRFRNEDISFGPFYGSDSSKIYYEVDSLIEFIKSSNLHPLSCAAQSHLELVRIHPYSDGNGRIARVLQNYLLHKKGYPSAIITPDDKPTYIALLRNALMDRLNGKGNLYFPSDNEQEFCNFISEKVLNSTEFLVNQMQDFKLYNLEIHSTKCPKIVNNISKEIKRISYGANHPVKTSVKSSSKKDKSIIIYGDIPRGNLSAIVVKACERYNPIHYSLE
ncbi:MAG: Fic family protein [Candidatus Pacearchaeota archaeon]